MRTSRRWAPGLLCILAGGCGQQAAGDPFAANGAAPETIACAVAGQTEFSDACAIDRTPGADGPTLTIRHPDGGFRRLLVTRDGRGVIAADGAEAARVSIAGDSRIEVTVGGDRYRLPATVKGADASPK
ncbi:MAG: hypothetical protein JWL91_1906 [Sphingomonas bacterium]|nr:hypothetical protein [Sphingomonas bacterium]MDB5690030.1 hypothetical protein [Sphingomonas bacterium]